jgi:hypothetical protein
LAHDLFSFLTAAAAASRVDRGVTGCLVEPGPDDRMTRKRGGLPRRGRKHSLGDIFRQVRVSVGLPESRGVNQVDVLPHKGGKRGFVPSMGITA